MFMSLKHHKTASVVLITLMVLPLSLMLSMPVNAQTTLEERADDDWYFNFGFGIQNERGDKIRTGGLRSTQTVGVRLSPTLAIEMSMQLAKPLLSRDSTFHINGGINWAFLPNLALNGSLGHRVIIDFDASWQLGPSADCDEVTELETRDWGAQIGLSSDWQWGGFTLGVDWFSIYQPLFLDEATQVTSMCEDESTTRSPDVKVTDLPMSFSLLTLKLGGSF
jgi:hypothetical protein